MPESVTGFDEMPLYDLPAGPASILKTRGAAAAFSAASCALAPKPSDDRELLELLLSGSLAVDDAEALAGALLDMFATAPRVLAARTDRLRRVPGLSEDAIAVLKAAEALGIRMARAEVPDTVRPSLGSYDKVHRVLPHARGPSRGRRIQDFVPQPEECAHRRRVPPERLRLPHAGLSPRNLHPLPGASGQRDYRPASAPLERSRTVPRATST